MSIISRRILLAQILLLLASCTRSKSTPTKQLEKLVIGIVAYGEGVGSAQQFQSFINYLQSQTKTLIELEPAYNEVQAVRQIQRQAWSLVFAPPGLAAIAISRAKYVPLFSLQGLSNRRSIIIVLKSSPVQALNDLNGKVIALGQPGSATGYYVPLYSLYGTTPKQVRISPTPQTTLEWVAKGEVAAGALSRDEFDRYRPEIKADFRVLFTSLRVPAGAVLISPSVESSRRNAIAQAMNEALPDIAQAAGYLPSVKPPEYNTLITFIEQVKPIEARIQEQPAPLYQIAEEKKLP
ncbi:phosphate/phosphite/phosphonate ABC transporter substrate-binding protein [Aliterella atlantica]|uniref:phosphate/phosphite/phosphonate ABC transporter substrate-binding protein n=1 Tax=Aliterella atlantica TaxID=1827278 RepID=UPI0005D3599B|nr:phosphate/phosphite/phosphonate ABC transporter substrate-binding protein [Aliterella atlantica]